MSTANKDFFDSLEKSGVQVSQTQQEQINQRLSQILNYEPRIGVFGKTGAGKSSLCNALFGADVCKISDVAACTRDPQEVLLKMGEKGLKLIDVPGVGESIERDEEYEKLYASLLPELDVVLWLIKADDRALATDEKFYKDIVRPHLDKGKAFFFVVNQVDKIKPEDWNKENHEPSLKQFRNIHEKMVDIAKNFDVALSKVIPISADEKYNLTTLVDEFVRALPNEKKITMFKAVDKEFQAETTSKHVKKSFLEVVENVICTTIDATRDVVCTVVEKVDDAKEWIIDRLPIIFGGRGRGCYITTAVCRNESKADNCYELETFRAFRDQWLQNQVDGKLLIQKYYHLAPQIVKLIDASEDRDKVYNVIHSQYLMPCLQYIEQGEMEKCKQMYMKMVENLTEKYILWT